MIDRIFRRYVHTIIPINAEIDLEHNIKAKTILKNLCPMYTNLTRLHIVAMGRHAHQVSEHVANYPVGSYVMLAYPFFNYSIAVNHVLRNIDVGSKPEKHVIILSDMNTVGLFHRMLLFDCRMSQLPPEEYYFVFCSTYDVTELSEHRLNQLFRAKKLNIEIRKRLNHIAIRRRFKDGIPPIMISYPHLVFELDGLNENYFTPVSRLELLHRLRNGLADQLGLIEYSPIIDDWIEQYGCYHLLSYEEEGGVQYHYEINNVGSIPRPRGSNTLTSVIQRMRIGNSSDFRFRNIRYIEDERPILNHNSEPPNPIATIRKRVFDKENDPENLNRIKEIFELNQE